MLKYCRYGKIQNAQDFEESYNGYADFTVKGKLLALYGYLHSFLHKHGNKFLPSYIPESMYDQFVKDVVSLDYAINYIKIEGTVISLIVIILCLMLIKSLMNGVF